MVASFSYRIREQQLWLTSGRSIFWEEERALIASDLHFGKTGHFRKSGLAVPQAVYKEDLQRLVSQIMYFQPRQLIIVGDLFHSRMNKEMDLFQRWRENFPDLEIHLIKGNHDILDAAWYIGAGIKVCHPHLAMSHFQFVHDIETDITEDMNIAAGAWSARNYSFSGHIHPGIRVSGAGRQSLCFPCFYFGKDYAVLPAFSRFTGVAMIQPEKNEHVFAIVEDQIMQIQ